VDWPAVLEGIKEDVCDNVADDPEVTTSNGKLPAFGASFARGIAADVANREVTAKALVGMIGHHADGTVLDGTVVQVNWAFFDDPIDLIVSLNAPGQRGPIKLEMSLKDATWQVTRIWLPPVLLVQANGRT